MSITEVETKNRFRISNVVTRAWEVLSANFVPFFAIAVFVILPMTIFELSYGEEQTLKLEAIRSGLMPLKDAKEYLLGYYRALGSAFLVHRVLGIIGFGVCGLAAFQQLRGAPRPWGDNLVHALMRFFPLLGVYVLSVLGVLAGCILLVIPGIMLWVRWVISSPVCVIERIGPIASLKRSAQLTDGNRWPLFGLYVFLVALGLVPQLVSSLLTLIGGRVVGLFASLVLQGAIIGYAYCLSVTVYEELRSVKEGIGNPAVGAVFD